VQAAIARGDLAEARRIAEIAQKQFPASDSWMILMQASVEVAEWKKRDQVSVG
jgi:hypothetical protein